PAVLGDRGWNGNELVQDDEGEPRPGTEEQAGPHSVHGALRAAARRCLAQRPLDARQFAHRMPKGELVTHGSPEDLFPGSFGAGMRSMTPSRPSGPRFRSDHARGPAAVPR